MRKHNWAWAAGLFEGEGCISVNKTWGGRYSSPRLYLQTTDQDVLASFHQVVGVGFVNGPYPKKGGKNYYVWSCAKKADVRQLLKQLLPYLGKRRAERAREMLAQL